MKHSQQDRLHFEKEDLRWATNELVAAHRASRLACNTLLEIGCGVGFQSAELAKTCKQVIAVDVDERKVALARKNAKELGVKIDFRVADALSEEFIAGIGPIDALFCDPHRPQSEQERKAEALIPSVPELLEKYSHLTQSIAIECPPQMRSIPEGCEREYCSVEGEVNRLTLYFGPLKSCQASAVILPKGDVLKSSGAPKPQTTPLPLLYLFEPDPAVVRAGLLGELCQSTPWMEIEGFLTSRRPAKSPFFKAVYRVAGRCEFEPHAIRFELERLGAGQAILRFSIPSEQYWSYRKSLEQSLSGKAKLYVFRFGSRAFIASRL